MAQSAPRASVGKASLWITMLQAVLLGIVAGLGGYLLLSMVLNPTARAQGQRPPNFQGGPPPPFAGGFPAKLEKFCRS